MGDPLQSLSAWMAAYIPMYTLKNFGDFTICVHSFHLRRTVGHRMTRKTTAAVRRTATTVTTDTTTTILPSSSHTILPLDLCRQMVPRGQGFDSHDSHAAPLPGVLDLDHVSRDFDGSQYSQFGYSGFLWYFVKQ